MWNYIDCFRQYAEKQDAIKYKKKMEKIHKELLCVSTRIREYNVLTFKQASANKPSYLTIEWEQEGISDYFLILREYGVDKPYKRIIKKRNWDEERWGEEDVSILWLKKKKKDYDVKEEFFWVEGR